MELNQATHGAELVSVTCRAPETSSEPVALFPHFLWLRHIGRYSPDESAAGVLKERVQAVKQPVMRVKQSQDLHCDGASHLGCGAHSPPVSNPPSRSTSIICDRLDLKCAKDHKRDFFKKKKSNWFRPTTVHSNALNRPGKIYRAFHKKCF